MPDRRTCDNDVAAGTTPPGSLTTPEQRRIIKGIVWWLKGDLFERVSAEKAGITEPLNDTTMVWQSPLKWTVLLSPRKDGMGWAGEVRAPDGSRVSTTSWVEINWLEEKLP